MGRWKVLLLRVVGYVWRLLGLALMWMVGVLLLLQLEVRIGCVVDLLGLVGAKGVLDRIVSNILFLWYGVRCDLQGRQRWILRI
jgi:hypothetical protein